MCTRLTDQPFVLRTSIMMRLRFIIISSGSSVFEGAVRVKLTVLMSRKFIFFRWNERCLTKRFGGEATRYDENKEAKFNRDRQNFIINEHLRWNRCCSSKTYTTTTQLPPFHVKQGKKHLIRVSLLLKEVSLPSWHSSHSFRPRIESLDIFSHTDRRRHHHACSSIGSDFNSSFFIFSLLVVVSGFLSFNVVDAANSRRRRRRRTTRLPQGKRETNFRIWSNKRLLSWSETFEIII